MWQAEIRKCEIYFARFTFCIRKVSGLYNRQALTAVVAPTLILDAINLLKAIARKPTPTRMP